MRHKHHIVPRYLGGTDDSTNLVELTPEEHAEAHLILWLTHRNKEDLLAAVGLYGLASKAEIVKEACTLAGARGNTKLKEMHAEDPTLFIARAEHASKAAKQKTQKAIVSSAGHEFLCIRDCARELNIQHSSIVGVLKGRRKTAGGLTFSYKETF